MIGRGALLAGLAASALAGCAGGGGGSPRRAPSAPAAPRGSIVVVPEVMAAAGLEGVIGSPAAALTRRFGTPRIDLAEGDARKLQFGGQACVLDIYLYPLAAGAEPTATHVEARIRQGGAPADPGACIREVERGKGAR
jgi:hypothetical protein